MKLSRRSFLSLLPFLPIAAKAALTSERKINPEWEDCPDGFAFEIGKPTDCAWDPGLYIGETVWIATTTRCIEVPAPKINHG